VGNNGLIYYKLIDKYLDVAKRNFTTPFYSLDGSLMDKNSIKEWLDKAAARDQTTMLFQPKLRSIRIPKFVYDLEYLLDKNIKRTLSKWHIKEKTLSPIDFGNDKFYRKIKRPERVRSETNKPLIESL
jgi:hypothetical protein